MCGRFSLTEPKEAVEEMFGVDGLVPFPPRYNIAPTQPILVVAAGEAAPGSNRPARRALLARWGLWPAWVKDPRDFPLIFNARTESALEKPAFRTAMRHRRILVPASGFYEWKRPPKGSKARPQAYWVRPKDSGAVAFAGLMETWSAPDGTEVDTACILTTAANAEFQAIHERMPLVVRREDFGRWLDCRTQEPRDVVHLMRPVEAGFFQAVAVSDRVNKVANAGPDIQVPAAEDAASRPRQPSLF